MRRLWLVANPHAGRGLALPLAQGALPALERAGWSCRIEATARAGHARQLAERALEAGADGLLAVGGDGTLHELAQAIRAYGSEAPPLGVLPAGGGNAVARELGVHAFERAVEVVAAGATRAFDAVECELGRETLWALNVVAWGLAAQVTTRGERMRFLGGARYTAAALLEIASPSLSAQAFAIDGEADGGAHIMGAVANTRYAGGGMCIAPQASAFDGKFELVRLRKVARFALLRLLSQVYSGAHAQSSNVTIESRRALQLELGEGPPLLIDGELCSARELRLTLRPAALRLFAPA